MTHRLGSAATILRELAPRAVACLFALLAAAPVHAETGREEWETFRGPRGEAVRLPVRLTIDTSRDRGFRLVKYSLTNDRETTPAGEVKAARLSQGGFLQFRALPPKGAGNAEEPHAPVALSWSAVEIQIGTNESLRIQSFDNPPHLGFFIDLTLKRDEFDRIWSPAPVGDSNAGEGSAPSNRIGAPLVRAHVVVRGYERISDEDAFRFRMNRKPFETACRAWAERTRKPGEKAPDVSGRVSAGSPDEVAAFVDFCVGRPDLFATLTKRPTTPAQKSALFAVVRRAWMDYELTGGSPSRSPGLVATPRATKPDQAESLDATIEGWSVVESHRALEVDGEKANWTLEEVAVHDYERESDQRVQFWPIGEWASRDIAAVGIEAVFTDEKSKHSVSRRFLAKVDEPYVWRIKSRYSEQLTLQWRVYACRLKDGKVVVGTKPGKWERKRAGVFDHFEYLDVSAADAIVPPTPEGE